MNYFENDKTIYFAKMKERAVLPKKEKENAGYDIYACFDEDYMFLKPFELALVPTGIAWASSENYYMQIEERSSTGSKGIKRNAGIIDSGYRGEIKISILNANYKSLIISNLTEEELKKKNPEVFEKDYTFYSTQKAIAQGIIHRVEDMEVKELSYEELSQISSNRGDKGFGSSNKV